MKIKSFFVVLVLLCLNNPAFAETPPLQLEFEPKTLVGLSYALPGMGLSIQRELSNSRTIGAVLGLGAQVQMNFTGDSPHGLYHLLSLGVFDDTAWVRGGIGYRLSKSNLSINGELSLNAPLNDDFDEDQALSALSYYFLYIPIGISIHYSF